MDNNSAETNLKPGLSGITRAKNERRFIGECIDCMIDALDELIISGWFFMMYMSMYRRVSAVLGYPCLALIPDWLVRIFKKTYQKYMAWRLRKGDAAVSLSGVNVFYDKEWFIPFDKYNTHPPYNGEGDLLVFRMSEATKFERYYRPDHPYSVVEKFCHPYKVMIADAPAWFHLHANRAYCEENVKNTKRDHPELFVLPENFVKMNYKEVLSKMDVNSTTLYQRILFALVHKLGSKTIAKHFPLLRSIKSVKS